jgi:hypothetical protein
MADCDGIMGEFMVEKKRRKSNRFALASWRGCLRGDEQMLAALEYD